MINALHIVNFFLGAYFGWVLKKNDDIGPVWVAISFVGGAVLVLVLEYFVLRLA